MSGASNIASLGVVGQPLTLRVTGGTVGCCSFPRDRERFKTSRREARLGPNRRALPGWPTEVSRVGAAPHRWLGIGLCVSPCLSFGLRRARRTLRAPLTLLFGRATVYFNAGLKCGRGVPTGLCYLAVLETSTPSPPALHHAPGQDRRRRRRPDKSIFTRNFFAVCSSLLSLLLLLCRRRHPSTADAQRHRLNPGNRGIFKENH